MTVWTKMKVVPNSKLDCVDYINQIESYTFCRFYEGITKLNKRVCSVSPILYIHL